MNNKPSKGIYVIDDKDIDRQISTLLLKKFSKNLVVHSMESGRAAIEKLNSEGLQDPGLLPDCIFLDIDMPDMNGWQFLSEYTRLGIGKFKKIDIFILSGIVNHEDVRNSPDDHLIKGVICKPLSLDNIKSIFETAE